MDSDFIEFGLNRAWLWGLWMCIASIWICKAWIGLKWAEVWSIETAGRVCVCVEYLLLYFRVFDVPHYGVVGGHGIPWSLVRNVLCWCTDLRWRGGGRRFSCFFSALHIYEFMCSEYSKRTTHMTVSALLVQIRIERARTQESSSS